jgi:hypothetical protein
MDAAIGRLHLSITVAKPAKPQAPAPKRAEPDIERAFRRERAERQAEAERTFWDAAFHSRGRF